MREEPPEAEYQNLVRRIHAYMTQENKRRNLVGEGFEDVIAAVIKHLPLSSSFEVRNRSFIFPQAMRFSLLLFRLDQ
jgi:hypothetical protein